MNPCCFICNTRNGVSLRNATSLFEDHNTLTSGKKVSEVLSEVIEKPVQENKVHTNILCKKCYKTCSEYDSIQVKLQKLKTELLQQFKQSLPSHNLEYENYGNITYSPPSKPKPISIAKKFVLPASKLQPIPPDLLLKVGKLASFTKASLNLPQIKPATASTLNLKVTVGSSVLTQTVKTTASKITEPTTIDHNILTSISNALKTSDIDSIISTQSGSQNNSIFSLNVNSLPKDFLSGAVLTKIDENDDGKVDENHDDHPMEIDEDCLSIVPVTSADHGDNIVLEVKHLQEKSQASDMNEYLNLQVPQMDESEGVSDAQKYILGKLQILGDNQDDEDEDEHTIVVNADENGSIFRMVSGQKLIYEGGEISLVMPDEDSQPDGDIDHQDNGDGQDSNDESQIELQVSGDEETAKAIIAAAQEQGGAYIKVEGGSVFRVQSVTSAGASATSDAGTAASDASHATSDASHAAPEASDAALQIVAPEGGDFKCLLCEKNEDNGFIGAADIMMRHLKTAHDARLYICQFCGVVMRKRTDYTTHIAEHASSLKGGVSRGPHRCGVCNKAYSSRTLLAEHANVHSGARPYACDVCHKAFASKYTLQAHLKTHNNRPRPYKCNQCTKSFLTKQNLNQHKKTHSGVKDFICSICNKAFSTQHNLEVHGVVHSGSKAFVCTLCGKAFARRAELRDHARIHTGERPFACDICGARFTQRSNLHSHRRATHLDDKRYHCQLCPKRFKRRRLLEYHIKATHTGERPLKCNFCFSSFVYPEHYKKHIRIHSGERPYVCEICGKSFNSRDNRNTHRFVHSDKKPYECVQCGAGYMRKQLLYAHMNTSGHLAESIVVNQPRVIKVTENGDPAEEITNTEPKTTKYDAIFELNELDASVKSVVKSEMEGGIDTANFYITDDKKLILQDNKTTLDLIQDSEDPTLLTIHNIGERTEGTILEAVSAEALEQAEIVANDENGGMVRLIQIKLPDGNNGWVALNR